MSEYITTNEISKMLNVGKATVQRWIRTNYLPASKFGKAFRVDKDEFAAWVAEKRHEPAVDATVATAPPPEEVAP